MSIINRASCLLMSLSSLGAGFVVASAHPAAPVTTFVFLGIFLLFLWRPQIGLFSLPVFLPFLNFSPWSGWLVVDEFDLLVLATVAAGFFRMQREGIPVENRRFYFLLIVIVALLAIRGASDLAEHDMDWFSGYMSPLNGFRVGKSLLWVVLIFPLFVRAGEVVSPDKVIARFFGACLLGACGVVLAVFWERAFFPGIFDISTPYRTVGTFWEMHHGGAALDVYLVLLAPLLVWAWRTTVSLPLRLILGALILAFVYTCLTTFSRGVIGASAASVLMLCALLVWRRAKAGQAIRIGSPVSLVVVILVVLEIVLVFGSDSFMNKRLAETERDFGGRLEHWEQGMGLLKTPDEWLFGIGLGKLPARLTQGREGLALSGSYFWRAINGRRAMVIAGPHGSNSSRELGGLYALTQRVDLVQGQRYHFSMDTRAEKDALMSVQVCAQHLLYPAHCQSRLLRLSSGGWQHWESRLSGAPFKLGSWQGFAHGLMRLSVLTPGTEVEFSNPYLSGGGDNLLRNTQFLEGGAGWFPLARSYFLPWHIDNLYLEIMIETGLVGLLSFFAAILMLVRRLVLDWGREDLFAPYLLSCIAGLMALGLVVSVLDMPRVALLSGLILVLAWQRSRKKSGQLP
jgi:O-antigen ligase